MNTDNFTISWKAWYVDDNIFDSTETTLDELPSFGFLAMRLWFANGKGRFISGNDYYYFIDMFGDIVYGQTDDTNTIPIGAIVKEGTLVSDEEMQAITNEMMLAINPLNNVSII